VDPLLKPDDSLRMTVFGEDDLASQARILKSGEASFPLIGLVKVGGLTVADATEKLRALYAQDYLVDPKVALTVDAYAPEFVSVVGAVATPGQVPIPNAGKLDMAAAVAAAGGLIPTADTNRITLTRRDGGSSDYSLQAIQSGGGPILGPGDRIVTYANPFAGKFVTIRGQVRRPGPLGIPLDGKLDIVTALTLAGDFTELANPKKITLIRGGRNTLLSFPDLTAEGAAKLYLQSGDVVQVAERFL
jgi:polysaccharide export outer membrane protein